MEIIPKYLIVRISSASLYQITCKTKRDKGGNVLVYRKTEGGRVKEEHSVATYHNRADNKVWFCSMC